MKTVKFPLVVKEGGVSARIRQTTKTVNGHVHTYYIVEYVLLGQRKQEWRAYLGEAKQAASDACKRIANGEQSVLELKSSDRLAYLRATESLATLNVTIDTACRDYRDAVAIL